tara:strand:+ start:1772 stop:2278 length:507 start_codon:yes stop_codon:yes gene_type:complete
MLTYEVVSKALKYNKASGDLKWSEEFHKRFAGKLAGSRTKTGYVELSLKRHRLYAHRIAWLLHYKEWPKGQIDHINGRRSDNRIENLREVDSAENKKNSKMHKGNSSGAQGVYFNKRAKKWQAYITVDYKTIYLGVFRFIEDAKTARKEAEVEYGFHKNHGRVNVGQL